MSAIRLLPDDLINKIKAGEMIERPANVLKELLENAIDAEARRIVIVLQKGGSDEIVVTDDGCGIAADDVPLAIKRHTTSKLSRAEDLWALHSLGFRGEALASIAEVSRLTLTTATAAGTGARLTTDNKCGVQVVPWSCAKGTSISVRDIFYNIPARRKFLKNFATEYAHCHTCVLALALSHPQIEFVLQHNGREQLRVAATSASSGEEALRLRAAALFGKETVAPLLYTENETETATVAMLFSPPGHDRPHGRHIFTFVNDRWIKSTTLKYAILRGYHSHLLKGRYPLLFAYLRVPPALLDVNVHPMKNEVRFQYDKDVQELLALALRRKLRSPEWSMATTPLTSSPSVPPGARPQVGTSLPARSLSPAAREQRIFYPSPNRSDKPNHLELGTDYRQPRVGASAEPERASNDNTQQRDFDWQAMTHIGVYACCYLLFEDQQRNLVVVDQHAFHERIIFEQLRADPQMLVRGQQLTITETLPLAAEEVELIAQRREEFARLGFELATVGSESVQVRRVPALLQQRSCTELVGILLDLARQDKTLWLGESLVDDAIATLACRAAVKAGDRLEPVRLQQLFTAAQGVDFLS